MRSLKTCVILHRPVSHVTKSLCLSKRTIRPDTARIIGNQPEPVQAMPLHQTPLELNRITHHAPPRRNFFNEALDGVFREARKAHLLESLSFTDSHVWNEVHLLVRVDRNQLPEAKAGLTCQSNEPPRFCLRALHQTSRTKTK